MVTPNRDRSVSIARLEADWEKAKLKGQGEIVRWASQHLNIEIGLALRSDRWAGTDFWSRAADTTLTLDALMERSEIVVMGIDGGGLDDLPYLGGRRAVVDGFSGRKRGRTHRSWNGGRARSR